MEVVMSTIFEDNRDHIETALENISISAQIKAKVEQAKANRTPKKDSVSSKSKHRIEPKPETKEQKLTKYKAIFLQYKSESEVRQLFAEHNLDYNQY
jgi:hypothetical protein